MSETTECPICYLGMDATTGSATTSCGHKFHIKCIATWYITNTAATCPCCRAKATDLEKPDKPASLIDLFLSDTIVPNNDVTSVQEWYNINNLSVQATNAQTIVFSDDRIIRW